MNKQKQNSKNLFDYIGTAKEAYEKFDRLNLRSIGRKASNESYFDDKLKLQAKLSSHFQQFTDQDLRQVPSSKSLHKIESFSSVKRNLSESEMIVLPQDINDESKLKKFGSIKLESQF